MPLSWVQVHVCVYACMVHDTGGFYCPMFTVWHGQLFSLPYWVIYALFYFIFFLGGGAGGWVKNLSFLSHERLQSKFYHQLDSVFVCVRVEWAGGGHFLCEWNSITFRSKFSNREYGGGDSRTKLPFQVCFFFIPSFLKGHVAVIEDSEYLNTLPLVQFSMEFLSPWVF